MFFELKFWEQTSKIPTKLYINWGCMITHWFGSWFAWQLWSARVKYCHKMLASIWMACIGNIVFFFKKKDDSACIITYYCIATLHSCLQHSLSAQKHEHLLLLNYICKVSLCSFFLPDLVIVNSKSRHTGQIWINLHICISHWFMGTEGPSPQHMSTNWIYQTSSSC